MEACPDKAGTTEEKPSQAETGGEIEILSPFFFPLGSEENMNMTEKNIFL